VFKEVIVGYAWAFEKVEPIMIKTIRRIKIF
jgi:hypothetical protein